MGHKEYVCRLGHVSWRKDGWGRCGEGGCPAPCSWTGRQRGFLLGSQDAWDSVWGLLEMSAEDPRGCWLWRGEMGSRGPRWRGYSVRRELWDWWWQGTWEMQGRRWKCGSSRCVRPSHSL